MNNSEIKKYNFHVHGMHCKSCVVMIEGELGHLANVKKVAVNLNRLALDIEGDFGNKTPEQIATELTSSLATYGYSISVEKENKKSKWSDFKIAIPITILFAMIFVALQKIGIINLVSSGGTTYGYGTVFVIGIIASLSTCMAVVGGLVLSMSATFAKEGDKTRPQIMFHLGRIISFFILGGVIGWFGSAFTLNTSATFILNLILGIVMIILGINLLEVFPWVKNLQPVMPKFIGKHAHGISKFNHSITPVLVGVVTFFLPCGFTQSMQIYTLTTGSFISGAFTMLVFALGTLPVLALISFSSFSIKNSSKAGVFFKTAGLIVILFAIFNIINSLVVVGAISPIFNF